MDVLSLEDSSQEDLSLEAMQEMERVNRAIVRFFVAVDEGDWLKVRDHFTYEVLFDMSSMGGAAASLTLAEDIVASWEEGLAPMEAVHHQIGNVITEVRGTTATVSCYGVAFHYLQNDSGENVRRFVGSYELGLLKEVDRWRINAFRFNMKFMDGNPNLEGAD